MPKLSELYFGDLEAFDEAGNNPQFFKDSFVAPESLILDSLRNNRRFVIIGRKGTGKTAVQMHLAETLSDNGYYTSFFRFSDDLRSDDYAEIAKTQSHISISSIANDRNIFTHYDFRDVWERVILNKIGENLKNKNITNPFISFVCPDESKLKNIFQGISRSLTLNISGDIGVAAAEIGIDLSKIGDKGEIKLGDFNRIARHLFKSSCDLYQMFFFVDELVFSKLDAREDEIRMRAAMVRDLIKTCRELNNFSHQEGLNFHFICTLRPEIRNLINDYDSEIGKIVDGRDAILTWYIGGKSNTTLLDDVFRKKIESSYRSRITFRNFVANEISFGKTQLTISEFLKTNTWGRPRDLVRLLLCIGKMNPNSVNIGESEIKHALDEYSRSSAKELIDELGVSYGQDILDALRNGIRRRRYSGIDEFLRALPLTNVDDVRLATELFELGLIGGFQPESGNYYWAHRGETYLKPHHQVVVHPALWNEFNIRGVW